MPTHRISFNFDEQAPGAGTTSAPVGVVSAPAAAPAGQGQGVGARFDYRAEFASATAASVGPSSAGSGSSTSAASGKGVTGSTPVLESASALTPPARANHGSKCACAAITASESEGVTKKPRPRIW